MAESDKEFGVLIGKVDSIKEQITQVQKILIVGNGHKSLLDRTTALEANLEELSSKLENYIEESKNQQQKTCDNVDKISKSVEELKKLVEEHLKDEEKHTLRGMLLKRSVIVTALISVPLVHEALESVPDLWKQLLKLFGG
jgi:peptidoglycan hydrolase CwlO-like protein